MSSTSRTRGMRSTSRIDSFRSAASDIDGPAAFDIAQQVDCLFAAAYMTRSFCHMFLLLCPVAYAPLHTDCWVTCGHSITAQSQLQAMTHHVA